MAANLALAGTAIGLSHLLGLLLLLYSLEKVSGVVSRTLKRVTGGKLGRANARDAEAPGASPSPELASSPSKTGHGSGLRAKGWVRGCACPVRGMCEGGLGSEGAGGGGGRRNWESARGGARRRSVRVVVVGEPHAARPGRRGPRPGDHAAPPQACAVGVAVPLWAWEGRRGRRQAPGRRGRPRCALQPPVAGARAPPPPFFLPATHGGPAHGRARRLSSRPCPQTKARPASHQTR